MAGSRPPRPGSWEVAPDPEDAASVDAGRDGVLADDAAIEQGGAQRNREAGGEAVLIDSHARDPIEPLGDVEAMNFQFRPAAGGDLKLHADSSKNFCENSSPWL